MNNQREKRAKLNIFFSLVGQLITLICGLVVPRLLIGSYGSEAYGATASIAQFLAYISLLEGGIGGVARSALYKPLAEKDDKAISTVVSEIRRFFRIVASLFCIYVVILALSFTSISHIECFDRLSTMMLVFVISISTFAQYFIGISYSVLLQAAQRTYITQIASSIATVLNAICVVCLVKAGSSLIIVKLVSSIVFALKPFVLWMYVKKEFNIIHIKDKNPDILKDKWTGLGQHIAYFIHSNTDVAVLTVLANLTYVAVYSVYNMVVSQIQNFTTSFSTGMEAVFGDMLAKKEITELHHTFDLYEGIISFVSGVLFSVTAVMIIPFVRIYTSGVSDVNYIYPKFAFLMVVASYLFCLRMPYHSMTIAAGCFKETKLAAYGEAAINIVLSVVLVVKFGLIGVAIGTLVAVSFRLLYYVIFLSRNVFARNVKKFLKRAITNAISFLFVIFTGNLIIEKVSVNNYVQWCIVALFISLISLTIQILMMNLTYKNLQTEIWGKVFRKRQ